MLTSRDLRAINGYRRHAEVIARQLRAANITAATIRGYHRQFKPPGGRTLRRPVAASPPPAGAERGT